MSEAVFVRLITMCHASLYFLDIMLLYLRIKVFESEFEFQVLTYGPLRQSEFRIAIFKEEKKMQKICLQPCHHQL